jgi:hypothetical protein
LLAGPWGDPGRVTILFWHVHGSYLLPTLPERGSWGGGRPAAWERPAGGVEVAPAELADTEVDIVVAQRPEELDLARDWLARTPGRDLARGLRELVADAAYAREHALCRYGLGRFPDDSDDLLARTVDGFRPARTAVAASTGRG